MTNCGWCGGDLPGEMIVCRHCGRRLRPSAVPAVILLVLVTVFAVVGLLVVV